MFFKNIMAYRFNRAIEFDVSTLEKQLKEFMFTPCGPTDKQKFGWVEVLGKYGECLTHAIDGDILITACKQIKQIPADKIKADLNAKVDALELQEGRPLKKAEKDQIKDEIIQDLLPRAFERTTHYNVLIMLKEGLILVDASSHNVAEEVLALLRKTIGSLPVVPVLPSYPMETVTTGWVAKQEYPTGFVAGEKAKLASILDDGGKAAFTNQNLSSPEVLTLIEAKKVVTQIELTWQDRITFLLTDQFAIKSVKWADELKDQNDDIPREDFAARFDADCFLVIGELRSFLPNLFTEFGGLPDVEQNGDVIEDFAKLADEDHRLIEARNYFEECKRVSVSGLQRKLLIGYATACELIGKLERCGVVSEANHMGVRELLLNKVPEPQLAP